MSGGRETDGGAGNASGSVLLSGGERIAVFAGTSEGRLLCEHLADRGIPATAFVATEYGREALGPLPGLSIRRGRMDEEQMRAALEGFSLVVDATHPYAREAGENIQNAAQSLGIRYLRLIRGEGEKGGGTIVVPDVQAAARYLSGTQGKVLVTTGSKELACYTGVPDFAARLYVRILPEADALEKCVALGFPPSRIICMQGPFSHELNLALLRGTGARWLVTKDSGRAGGVPEKLSAARAAGARVLLIARPVRETGYTLDEIRRMLTGNPEKSEAPGRRFPLFVDLSGASCLVVGGGEVALRRIRVLREFGARVTVVSPRFRERPEGVRCLERRFRPGDTAGMRLVVAATDERETNRAVAAECGRAGIPVSVADAPAECSFFFPVICSGSRLTAGIVSTGEEHSLTARSAAAIRILLKEMDP